MCSTRQPCLGDQRTSARIRGLGHDRLAITRNDMWPSREVFPADAPFGPLPVGLHLLDWDGTHFAPAAHLTGRFGY